MTKKEQAVLVTVVKTTWRNKWYRAADSGERVTLAALWRKGLIDRHAWRGRDGDRDTAYEYQAAPVLLTALRKKGVGPSDPTP